MIPTPQNQTPIARALWHKFMKQIKSGKVDRERAMGKIMLEFESHRSSDGSGTGCSPRVSAARSVVKHMKIGRPYLTSELSERFGNNVGVKTLGYGLADLCEQDPSSLAGQRCQDRREHEWTRLK